MRPDRDGERRANAGRWSHGADDSGVQLKLRGAAKGVVRPEQTGLESGVEPRRRGAHFGLLRKRVDRAGDGRLRRGGAAVTLYGRKLGVSAGRSREAGKAEQTQLVVG